MVNPMRMKASLYSRLRNPSPKQTAPIFPPAPTIPEMAPVAGGSGSGRVDVGDDSIGGTLGGMDKKGKEDHNSDGRSKGSCLAEDQNEDTLADQTDRLGSETSTHSYIFVAHVRNESSETTGEQVHESENGSDGGGFFGFELEHFLEVQGGSIVHSEFDAEAAGVLDEK